MLNYCVFDDNIPIDEDNFAVGIIRKPNGKNSEHAFLVVEGRDSANNAILRRYDLLVDKNSPEGRSLIRIQPEIICSVEETKKRFENEIVNNEEVYKRAWSLPKQQAELILEDIRKEQTTPPIYQVSGDKLLIAKSSSREGQSCFSWARQKLHNLKNDSIKLPEKYTDFVGAKTSLDIPGNRKEAATGCSIF